MKKEKAKGKNRVLWGFIYIGVFIVVFFASAAFKLIHQPAWTKNYTVNWDASIGQKYTDLTYGEKESNTFDLYVPADHTKETYGLVVYLHAGGFTSGDKSDDTKTLEWLCSKGYVAAGINYTLFSEQNPAANIYTQSIEIKESIPYVIAEAKKLGYSIDEMAVSGGSAGHCLAMLYAYRDAADSPVPVKMVFGAVGPSSFYPQDWECYGIDSGTDEAKESAAGLFSVMAGKKITPDMFDTPAYDEAVKDISALLWVDEHTVPSLFCYGAHDKVQSFPASKRLDEALTAHNIPHDYLVLEHSGHGLQNDSKDFHIYYQKIEEYLASYMPVK